jgi:hypothetical protein
VVVAITAVVVFAVVVVAAIVIIPQLGRSGPTDERADPTPAFVTKTTLEGTTTTIATTTTDAPTSTTDPPTSPSTTTLEAGLAKELGEDATANQLRVPPKPAARGQYKFLNEVAAQPVSFNACRTIHYVVRVGVGPANGLALVTKAIQEVSAATGLRFQYDGPTTTVPHWEQPVTHDVTSIADEFAPVFIGWATPAETDIWAHAGHDVLGVGGPETLSINNGAGQLYVTGHAVVLPSTEVSPTFGPGVTTGNLLLHELGHVVGLDHVTEAGEIMEPDLGPQAPDGYGPGDLQGLYALGSSRGCASTWLFASSKAGAGP